MPSEGRTKGIKIPVKKHCVAFKDCSCHNVYFVVAVKKRTAAGNCSLWPWSIKESEIDCSSLLPHTPGKFAIFPPLDSGCHEGSIAASLLRLFVPFSWGHNNFLFCIKDASGCFLNASVWGFSRRMDDISELKCQLLCCICIVWWLQNTRLLMWVIFLTF